MTADGCGIVELNPPQHSIKQREKSGLDALIDKCRRREQNHGALPNLVGPQSFHWRRRVMIGTTLGLHIPSSKSYAIASEIAPTQFRMLPSTRFAPSNRVRMSSMKVIWHREQLNRGGSGEQGTTTCK